MIYEYIESLEDTSYVKYASGLYYIELIPGTGPFPADEDTVYFKYKAAFTDYVQFDWNRPYSTPFKYIMGSFVGMTMKGVDEGLHYMKAGGTARLLTPSSLAYGFEGLWGVVPGYTPVVWTIELDSIKPHAGR
ncbi:MAG: FKBP-type peptidyl-prolyl cis-trans isomerase [Bacteroidales bacterium]|nr:FKBP-type peptidyl-prolyl cis-trans isomerase [Bacteroidales bacterium]MBN2634255.1 FKBP-type peptidyl-prolyl cis-trans isomerase [Bacteroidales bacterium]